MMTKHFCFWHIPKTGGTWIRNVLRKTDTLEVELTHRPPQEQSIKVLKRAATKINFSLIRHPVTWYQSLYANDTHWKKFKGGWLQIRDMPSPNWWLSEGFNAYIRRVAVEKKGWLSRYYSIVLPYADYILRFEEIPSCFIAFLEKHGFTSHWARTLGRVNPGSSMPHFRDVVLYEDDALQAIVESEREAIDRYYGGVIPDDVRRVDRSAGL